MSILIDRKTKLVVQGMTGREGEFHTKQMLAYGTNVVAGMTPGRGGEQFWACRCSTQSCKPSRQPARTRRSSTSRRAVQQIRFLKPLKPESNWLCVLPKGCRLLI
jgi:hypothetical protein